MPDKVRIQNMSVASDLTGLLASYGQAFGVPQETIGAALAEAGVREPARREAGVTGRMPYRQWCDALAALYRRVDDPLLGVHIGGVVAPAHCGVLGYLALSADTLGEALVQFERYQQLLYGGGLGKAEITGERLRFVWPAHERDLGVGLSDETLVFGLVNFVRIMVGGEMDPAAFREWLARVRADFVHRGTASQADYRSTGVGELHFRQPALALSLPVSVLRLPVSRRDPALFHLLNQQAESLLRVLPESAERFDEKVRDYLRKALPEGSPTLEGLAAALALSTRSVHRRLNERGLNFRTLLRQTRLELARQYLDEGRISLSEIAFLLGYSEQSAFTRAFRSWTGQSPLQYQRRGAL